jgi:hypothetical protein
MPQSVEMTFDMLVDLGADTLIKALFLAALMALMAAYPYLWLRRGRSEMMGTLISLFLVGNLACFVVGAAFIQLRDPYRSYALRQAAQNNRRVPEHRRAGRPIAWRRASFPRPAPARPPADYEAPPASPD